MLHSVGYRSEKKKAYVQGLEDELGGHSDLRGQTQRDGTKRETYQLDGGLNKNLYWRTQGAGGYSRARTSDGLRSAYEPVPADQYAINIIVDPCRGHEPDCCQDVFGTPQYVKSFTRYPTSVSTIESADESGGTIPMERSRLMDNSVFFDPGCTSEVVSGGALERSGTLPVKKFYDSFGNDMYSQCIGENLAMDLELKTPRCWDHNATVNSTLTCSTVNGDRFSSCVAIGYFASAAIVQCGGKFREDDHCGTFIELHAAQSNEEESGSSGRTCDMECNEQPLSQVRLEGGFVGGYRTTTIPLTILGNSSQVVCEGKFELWWVQRTRWGFITQFKKK